MRFYETSFFQDNSPPPKLIINKSSSVGPWYLTAKLNMRDENYNPSEIVLYLRGESDLISFVNSVKSAYDKYRKDQGYDR
jgi:hypothetical protein